ncbi:hypothetical protein [Streptomyces sp. NPDC048639]|uniref:hypothetical protein n=1 Tax=Streptomyces sp. NPDC048639 TaxID=3365581 RepID=UPI0037113986
MNQPKPYTARDLVSLLSRGLLGDRRTRPAPTPRRRLDVPSSLPLSLGCDAVGVSRHLGPRILEALPRTGCVFDDGERWWWVVPSGSHQGVTWPPEARYAVGGYVSAPRRQQQAGGRPGAPRLIHWPDDTMPYTHPILLYVAVCRATGSSPTWSDDWLSRQVHAR